MSKPERMKYGFHYGPDGHKLPIQWFHILDEAGIPFCLKITDSAPDIQVCEIARNSDVPHSIIFRRSVGKHGSVGVYDVPSYHLSPMDASAEHFQLHYDELPPEVITYKDVIMIEDINEPDKDRAEWLAEFSMHQTIKWNNAGFKYLCFGWSGGEPEPEHWQGPKMLDLLRMCNGISLHEYSFSKDIWNGAAPDGSRWLMGRFEHLHAVCDANGIRRPEIHITEAMWGRDKGTLPDQPQRMIDYDEVGAMYAAHPNIKSVAIWCFNGGEWGTIGTELYKDYPQLLNMMLDTEYPPVEEQPPMDKPKIVIVKKPQIDQMTLAENQQVSQWAYENYGRTATHSHDDMLTMLSIGNADSYTVVWWAERQPDIIQMLQAAGYDYILMPETSPEPSNPLDGLKLGHLFSYQYSDSYSPFDSPRGYGNGLHEGLDADVIGGEADNKASVLCTYAGIVERSLDSTGGYGKYVRVQHERNGSPFYTRYCHLDARFVNVGDSVAMGQPLGEVGATGNVTGEHVHFNLEVPNYGLRGYVVDWVVDPFPYLPSDNMSLPPINSTPPPAKTYRTSDFMIPDPRAWVVVQRADGSGEDIYTIWRGNIEERVKNGQQKEVYVWRDGAPYRLLDTSMAPVNDITNPEHGIERLYKQFVNGVQGGQIAPAVCEVGKTYTFYSDVKVYAKSDCRELSTHAGNNVPSTFQLVARRENYTFANGFTVDVLYETIQTGELQLYCIKNGVKMGWSGGGAKQSNNNWGAMPKEFYIDRAIPQTPPPGYC